MGAAAYNRGTANLVRPFQEAIDHAKMHRDGFGTWTIAATLRCTVLAVEWALISGSATISEERA